MDLFGAGPPRGALLALGRLDFHVLDGAVLGHEGDQPVVEILGGVVAHSLEGLGERRNLDQARHVAPGPHVELDVGQLHPKDLIAVFLEPRPLLHDVGRPLVEGHHQVDPLLEPDGLHAEHLGDVDDPDAAALHVAAVERAARRHEFALVEQLDDREVVGDEGVPALDEGERAFALSDARVAAKHHADPLNVQGRRMLNPAGGEFIVDAKRRQVHEIHRDERSLEKRQVHLGGDREHRLGRVVIAREDDAGDAALRHFLERDDLVELAPGLQERHLGRTYNLYPLVGKILEESGQREGRPVDAPFADQPVQPRVPGHELQFELFAVGVVEMGDSNAVDGLLHGTSSAH
jgi:hypothetical protein